MSNKALATAFGVGLVALTACTVNVKTAPSTTPAATSVASSAPVVTTAAPTTVVTTVAGTAPATSAPASTVERTVTKVDAAAFKMADDGAYYFLSPSGKIVCGGGGSGRTHPYLIGCQTEQPVATMPDCAGDKAQQPLVGFRTDGRSAVFCTTEGIFWPMGTAKTLQYGETLTVPGQFTCTSEETGMTCAAEGGTGGKFTIAREGIKVAG